jgi:hypothetical protein
VSDNLPPRMWLVGKRYLTDYEVAREAQSVLDQLLNDYEKLPMNDEGFDLFGGALTQHFGALCSVAAHPDDVMQTACTCQITVDGRVIL